MATGPIVVRADELHLPTRRTVSSDTYSNALFEHQWRSTTRLRGLVLALDVGDDRALRVMRRQPKTGHSTPAARSLRELNCPVSIVLPSACPIHARLATCSSN